MLRYVFLLVAVIYIADARYIPPPKNPFEQGFPGKPPRPGPPRRASATEVPPGKLVAVTDSPFAIQAANENSLLENPAQNPRMQLFQQALHPKHITFPVPKPPQLPMPAIREHQQSMSPRMMMSPQRPNQIQVDPMPPVPTSPSPGGGRYVQQQIMEPSPNMPQRMAPTYYYNGYYFPKRKSSCSCSSSSSSHSCCCSDSCSSSEYPYKYKYCYGRDKTKVKQTYPNYYYGSGAVAY